VYLGQQGLRDRLELPELLGQLELLELPGPRGQLGQLGQLVRRGLRD